MKKEEDSYFIYVSARSLREAGHLNSAIEMMRRSIEIMPHFKSCELIGEWLIESNEITAAIVFLSAACGLSSTAHRSRFLLGKCYALLGEEWKEDAIYHLTLASRGYPNYKLAIELLKELEK